MKQINTLLNKRLAHLLHLKQEKEKALQSVPKGTLRICPRKTKTQYYHRIGDENHNGIYIPDHNIHLVESLAQKDYDTKVLFSIDQEIKAIQRYFSAYPNAEAESIYDSLHKDRQKFVHPITEPEDQFVKNWESVAYQGKNFDKDVPELYTARGERVRSKSEIIIADLLNREAIPYRYEYPIHLKGFGNIYPDFTVLNVRLRKEMYWEHLGMMDVAEYAEKAVQKIITYEHNGIYPGENLILTYETKQNPVNQKHVSQLIQHYLL